MATSTFSVPSWRDPNEEDLLGQGALGQTQTGQNVSSAFGAGDKTVPNPAPTSPNQSPFDITNTELFKQSATTAKSQLAGELPGWTAQANQAREAFQAAQAQEQAKIREQLMGAGAAGQRNMDAGRGHTSRTGAGSAARGVRA
jgi:hypothetical protein